MLSVSVSVKIILKLLNHARHSHISKIITGEETYIPCFDIPVRQEYKVWMFLMNSHLELIKNYWSMVKKQRSIKTVMYAVCLDIQEWSQPSSLKDRS